MLVRVLRLPANVTLISMGRGVWRQRMFRSDWAGFQFPASMPVWAPGRLFWTAVRLGVLFARLRLRSLTNVAAISRVFLLAVNRPMMAWCCDRISFHGSNHFCGLIVVIGDSWKCSCKPRSGSGGPLDVKSFVTLLVVRKLIPIGTVQAWFIGRVAIGVDASGGSDGSDFLLGFR